MRTTPIASGQSRALQPLVGVRQTALHHDLQRRATVPVLPLVTAAKTLEPIESLNDMPPFPLHYGRPAPSRGYSGSEAARRRQRPTQTGLPI